MFKLLTLACLVAVAFCDFQNVDFDNCDSDAGRFGQLTMLQLDANPIELQQTALHVNADINIMQDMTTAANQASLDASVLSLDVDIQIACGIARICKGGSFLINDRRCTLAFCDTVGSAICDQLKTKKAGDVFSLRNVAIGPATDLGWFGLVFQGMITIVDVQATIQSPDYKTNYACGELKGRIDIDFGNI